MRNLKKVLAVALSLVMLLCVAAISASAATTPKISLVGMSSTGATGESGYFYEVDVVLADADNAVGGIEGVITYDPAVLTYADVDLSDGFAANNTVENSIAQSAGSIKFVGLATGDGVWFTVKFTVAATDAVTNVTFSNVKGAKVDGSDYITVDTADMPVSVVNNNIVKVGGAAIKLVETADAQDIMFQALVDATALENAYPGATVTVKKIGAIMGISKALDGVELEVGVSNNNQYAIEATTDYDQAEDFAINLNNMRANLVGVKIVSRAYIVVDVDGQEKTIYSNNYDSTYTVANGCGNRSVLDVAKKAINLAIDNEYEDTVYVSEDEFNGKTVSQIAAGSIPNNNNLLKFIFSYIKAADAAGKLVVSE